MFVKFIFHVNDPNLGIFNCGHRLPTDYSISLDRRRFDTILENEKRVCVCTYSSGESTGNPMNELPVKQQTL